MSGQQPVDPDFEPSANGFGQSPSAPVNIILAVLRRPWIPVVVIFAIMVPLFIYLSHQPVRYVSQSQLMVSTLSTYGAFGSVSPLSPGGMYLNTNSFSYYRSILESRQFRQAVRNRLISEYPDAPADTLEMALGALAYRSDVQEEGFITIYAVTPSEQWTYRVTKAGTDAFQDICAGLERTESEQVYRFINSQIDATSAKIETTERQLQHFLESKHLLVEDMESGIGKELLDLERELSQAKAKLELVKINISSYNDKINSLLDGISSKGYASSQRFDQIRNELQGIRDELNALESSRGNEQRIAELRDRRSRLLSELVSLDAQVGAAQGRNAASEPVLSLQRIEEQLDAALLEQFNYQNQVNYYEIQIRRFREEHPDLPQDILEFAKLVRGKDVLINTLNILLQKREETRIKLASEQGGVKVIDEPSPATHMARKRPLKLVLGFFFALVAGIGVSFLVDYFDFSIKDEREVSRLGLSSLGTVPIIRPEESNGARLNLPSRSKNIRHQGMLIHGKQRSIQAEAFRSIKIALQFIAADQRKKVFVVSSPYASEGKSFITSNLGIVFAMGGKRTLLIDVDQRRSTLYKYFEVHRKPGLSEHLLEQVPLERVIQKTAVENLDLITGGSPPPNPAELAASNSLKNLVRSMREKYDIILLDTPPILVCTDPVSALDTADGIILVVRMERTNFRSLELATEALHRVNADILGVVFNHTNRRFGAPYYYLYRHYKPYSYYSGYGYYNYYTSYYEKMEKEEDTKQTSETS